MIDRDLFPVDPWRLVETSYPHVNPGVSETLMGLGNGYLGLRGNHIEGRNALEHGTFINGLHETWKIRHAEQAFGFAEVGQTIVNAPDAKVMRVYVDDEPLSFDEADVREYRRELDFRTGVLSREVLWETPSGKRVRIRDERIVSFVERHLAVLRLEVTVENSDAPVTISCQLLNRQDGEDVYGGVPSMAAGSPGEKAGFDPRKAERIGDRVLQPAEYWQDGGRSALAYRVADSGMTLAVVADHLVETENEYTARQLVEPDIAKNVFRVQAKAGVPTRVTKLVSYHTSRGVPARELIDRCRRTLDRAAVEGVEAEFAKQAEWLTAFWERSDVRIAGHDDLQQATRWCLFQIAQASARADGAGVSAKGVSGSGYGGHYFWDTEVYVLPFLTYTSPQFARNALRCRVHMLPAARRRAGQLNEGGALFPWRTINGEEASAYYAAGTAQYHINADVSYALGKYVRATGDDDFLYRQGVDIAVETARMWATLGFWRSAAGVDTFHIHGVTGPDEYTTVVNDNLFTNVMARYNLRFAARVVREMAADAPEAYDAAVERLAIEPAEVERWERAADAMHIPFSPALGIHPQDSLFLEREVWDLPATPAEQRPLLLHFHPLVIYRFQVLKQADVVLALFLQGNHFSEAEKLADFEYYDPLTTGDSTLSAVVQSILAAEVGYQDLAHEYFEHAIYVDLGDLHRNASDGVHVASAGGVWTALVCGFGGMRDHDGELSFDPRLPTDWPELSYPLQWHGSQLQITLTADQLLIEVRSGDPVSFTVRGAAHTASIDAPAAVYLADQGPVLRGRPEFGSQARREDGTILSPTVPTTSAIPIVGYVGESGE
ncbi:glycosyl hydrolase family 65 protein [Microbacterium sp. 13-71-7]|jgi:alpha,alpha-trehalose phosphorylase|uniref:glycoside hydrolase family 65 protein n=1 Tax=Microbacterium sp. 13-71-7 TaxID=1970399 RepID=UPI000BC429C5|nr:glycosyl hydrolase family 65 protein [Microbacterium sp. 13-71-7]OZB81241.1 MAG: family 65 glycosyl hydrolase [Microbacterium sp. 13-71-7]